MPKKTSDLHGWINLDKPLNMTSTKALGAVKKLLNVKKAGHAGTLDPLATGCLPLALGEATKTVPFAQNHKKIYEFEISWGEQRSTDDVEGKIIRSSPSRPTRADLENILPAYIGKIQQAPPQFSAVKIKGQRAYDLARKGKKTNMQSREVNVHDLEIISFKKNSATFKAICGKGVYIRSLARDIGNDLGCYGYVSSLRRLQVGPFNEKSMITLDNLEKIVHSVDLQSGLLPVETVLADIPAIEFSSQEAFRMKNGQWLGFYNKADVQRLTKAGIDISSRSAITAYATFNNSIFALIEIERCKIKPARILNLGT